MDILLLEALVPEAMKWLRERHTLELAPQLATDPRELRSLLYHARSVVLPRAVMVNRDLLDAAPLLEAIARLQLGTDNTDLEACRERSVRVIHPSTANVRSNAEYLLGCLLNLFRPGMAAALAGQVLGPVRQGRELHGSVVGILGLAPTAHALAPMLRALGMRVIGYDPAIHHTAPIWQRLEIEAVTLPDLMKWSHVVSLQMLFASRYKGFVNDKVLANCKMGQVWMGISRSSLFDAEALAAALQDGRIDVCQIDGCEADFVAPTSPLHGLGNLLVTPRLGSQTQEARLRASWYVAHRLHQTLEGQRVGIDSLMSRPLDPSSEPSSQWLGI